MRFLSLLLLLIPINAFADWQEAGVFEKGRLYAWNAHQVITNNVRKGMVKWIDYRGFSNEWIMKVNCKTRENSALYGYALDQKSNFSYDLPPAETKTSSLPGTPYGNALDIVCKSDLGALPDRSKDKTKNQSGHLSTSTRENIESKSGDTYIGTDDNGTIILTDDASKIPKRRK